MQTARIQKRLSQLAGPRRWTVTVLGVAMVAVVGLCGPAAAASTDTPAVAPQPGTAGSSTTTSTDGTAASGQPSTTTTTAPSTSTTTTNPTPLPSPSRSGTALIPFAGAALNGVGSSFAAPAIETWNQDVGNAPYSLSLNYTSSNSGDGRYQFTNQTTDFAVSDIGYVGSTDTTPPSFPFIFVPITAGGIAFMYNIPGLSQTIQLSSYTACAIMTGGITNWNDSHIAGDNPGVSLPNLKITPVTESDSAGTNYVLEEWCIDEQPALWAAFVQQQESQSGGPTDGVAISPTSPNSNWPGVAGGLDTQSTTQVAGDVAANQGAMGAVQLQYAVDLGFGTNNPAKGVASVKNSSGQYTQPSAVDVASALAYATQQTNGTHVLNFNGVGPHVYNPSTYSYLLTPTTGWSSAKGATMSAYVNYVLTLGQQKAPSFGYASLGLSLEQYGINSVTLDVPGAVAVTAAEKAAYACGDLTPSEVQAGQTTPTCGVTNGGAVPPAPPNAGNGGSGSAGSGSTTSSTGGAGGSGATANKAGAKGSTASATGGGVGASAYGGAAGGVDPGVSLSGDPTMAYTGGNPLPLTVLGLLLLGVGWIGRRRILRARQEEGCR